MYPKDFLELGARQSDLEEMTSPEEKEAYDDYEKSKSKSKKKRTAKQGMFKLCSVITTVRRSEQAPRNTCMHARGVNHI